MQRTKYKSYLRISLKLNEWGQERSEHKTYHDVLNTGNLGNLLFRIGAKTFTVDPFNPDLAVSSIIVHSSIFKTPSTKALEWAFEDIVHRLQMSYLFDLKTIQEIHISCYFPSSNVLILWMMDLATVSEKNPRGIIIHRRITAPALKRRIRDYGEVNESTLAANLLDDLEIQRKTAGWTGDPERSERIDGWSDYYTRKHIIPKVKGNKR